MVQAMDGKVHQIAVSSGGVPKLPVTGPVDLHADGVAGDDQADRKHHGGPGKHVCLFSLEVIEALRAEGHPIYPGAAGENITVAGIDWNRIQPGQRLHIGPDAVIEITWPATPCGKNSQWFADRNSKRIDFDLHPGWSRWYASVVTPGLIESGDSIVVST